MRRIAQLGCLTLLALLVVALAPRGMSTAAYAQDHGDDAGLVDDGHADDGHADDGHGGHEKVGAIPTWQQGLVTGIVSIVVFFIVLAILGSQVWPRIVKGLDERTEKIRAEITAAEEARAQSKQALEQYEVALREAEAESRRMLDETKAAQQKLAADLRSKADAELTSMKDRARAEIESAKKQAITEIYTESANLATMVAAKILQREVSSDDQQRLLDESIREMQSIQ